jgi:hypothetical protein
MSPLPGSGWVDPTLVCPQVATERSTLVHPARLLSPLVLLVLAVLLVGCEIEHPAVRFEAPAGLLTESSSVEFSLRVPPMARDREIEILVDEQPIPRSDWSRKKRNRITGVLHATGEGVHEVRARIELSFFKRFEFVVGARDSFEVVSLARPDVCEVLVASDGPTDPRCLFPWPSSRYLVPARTPTGVRVALPPDAMPEVVVVEDDSLDGADLTEQQTRELIAKLIVGNPVPLDPAPFNTHDGFSPTVQILMHFPGGVDVEASGASRLLPETRTFDLRSLDRDSPTVLLDADTGERIPHFIENDFRATPEYQDRQFFGGDFLDQQATILRPGRSLTPGHRYIVAVRGLVHPDGSAVEAEPVFAALRDRRPSDVPAVESRRREFEAIFKRLRRARVLRDDLILAFDFVVASDEQLTGEMLSMREQAFDFLRSRGGGADTVVVESVQEVNVGCTDPNLAIWKEVQGTFEVPLFLNGDPYLEPGFPGRLQTDAEGRPEWTTTTAAPFGLAIPCSALEGPVPPLVVGHGLFGTGPSTVSGLTGAEGLEDFRYVSAGTNWAGLSGPDLNGLPNSLFPVPDIPGFEAFFEGFIGQTLMDFDDFPAMGDRLRQGQLATLVLARLMSSGALDGIPAFQTPEGRAVIDPSETFYFGGSLGGIMGIMFGALTPDVKNLNVDVPGMNFSLLLQRATPFEPFEIFLQAIEPNPNVHLLTLGMLHETWMLGEAAGYATHVTHDPLPGTNAKNVLMTVALYDQQVSNIASEISGATLRLPNLEGSVMAELPLLPSRRGPLPSAYVVYDAATFDPMNRLHAPFIPPLTNVQALGNQCDPHGRRGFIPASIEQLMAFLQPGGRIENFCTDDGLCNASEPFEIPYGESERCDPFR